MKAAEPAILGLDNVRLEVPLAGVGSRSLAAVVDYLLLALLLVIWVVLSTVAAGALRFAGVWLWALTGVGAFLIQWGYFAGLEIAMNGQTPGKQMLALRVVSRHGGRAGASALVIRSLLRAVDLAAAVPMMFFDSRARRLGDLLAGTLVVHEGAAEGSALELGRLPAGCRPRQVRVVESFLRRADQLEPDRANHLAARIVAWTRRQDPELYAAHRSEAAGVDSLAALRRLLAVRER